MKRVTLLLLALALALPATALGAAKSHRLNVTIHGAVVRQQGSALIIASEITDRTLGSGALIDRLTNDNGKLKLVFTLFNAKGSFNGTIIVTATPQPDGGLTYQGDGKIKGGSRLYRHATGKIHLQGSQDAAGHHTGHVTGKIRF